MYICSEHSYIKKKKKYEASFVLYHVFVPMLKYHVLGYMLNQSNVSYIYTCIHPNCRPLPRKCKVREPLPQNSFAKRSKVKVHV